MNQLATVDMETESEHLTDDEIEHRIHQEALMQLCWQLEQEEE